jgi:hypothetical protein
MTRAISENSTLLPGAEPGSSLGKSTISSRRAVLTAGLAMSVAAAAPACAAVTPIDPDAELVSLAGRLKRLHPAIVEASERLEEAGERYDAIKPEKSPTLTWRWAVDADLVEKYQNSPYCTDESIDALRGKEFVVWEFTGTSEEFEQLDPMYLGKSVLPVPGHEHLFVSKPDERPQRRAAELIGALDEYRVANEAAIAKSGFTRAAEAVESLEDERDAIADRMLHLKPKTLRGLQALAAGLVYAEWSGDIGRRPVDSLEDEMIATIVRALVEDSSAAA